MKAIKEFVDEISDELEGAKEYAEKYVEAKAKGDMATANRFKEMATDELKHSSFIHEMAVKKIDEVSKVFVAPVEMQEAWDKAHKVYVEQAAFVRQMLSM